MKVHSVQYHRIIIDVNIAIVVRSCRRRLGFVLWNVYFVVEGEWHFHQIRQQANSVHLGEVDSLLYSLERLWPTRVATP